MSKERLEEIKVKNRADVYDCKLSRFDIDWLIEQAERVQEMGKELERIKVKYRSTKESHYRYSKLISELERHVQESEKEHKEYVSFTESNNYNMDVEFEKLYKQNKRYRETLKGVLKIMDSEDWSKYDASALQDNIDDYITLENSDLLEGEE